ncbi:phage tail protein [Staphylococcus equorum]|uniref:phage tail domain-containing protein n=1 Tax=Staphylococcus equorum TaxID=246432 RepID=UPI000853E838|nr:phage tail domain-containing protein [Staphylococcus equorum]OEK72260.1 phage tail protein [Staphylococcus equorum]
MKTVKIYDDSFEKVLTDITNFEMLDFEEEGVEVTVNSQEMKGRDGVGLLGPASFGPFQLILRFVYQGQDTKDYNLLKQRLRGLLFRRTPYYLVHSDMPGKKYAVYCEENAVEDVYDRDGTFEVTFNVYKGYSESLLDTSQMNLSRDTGFQFEGGNLSDSGIKYKHTSSRFKIFNGSDDAINPLLGYNFKIKINVDAPKGFKLINHTTGQEFEYKKAITRDTQILIDGVHPIIDNERVGIDTNWGWLTLDKGFNDIEIAGDGIKKHTVEFIFNYVYR